MIIFLPAFDFGLPSAFQAPHLVSLVDDYCTGRARPDDSTGLTGTVRARTMGLLKTGSSAVAGGTGCCPVTRLARVVAHPRMPGGEPSCSPAASAAFPSASPARSGARADRGVVHPWGSRRESPACGGPTSEVARARNVGGSAPIKRVHGKDPRVLRDASGVAREGTRGLSAPTPAWFGTDPRIVRDAMGSSEWRLPEVVVASPRLGFWAISRGNWRFPSARSLRCPHPGDRRGVSASRADCRRPMACGSACTSPRRVPERLPRRSRKETPTRWPGRPPRSVPTLLLSELRLELGDAGEGGLLVRALGFGCRALGFVGGRPGREAGCVVGDAQ